MSRKISECLPFEFLKTFTKKYPNAWEQADIFLAAKRNNKFNWDDRCYLPISATLAIMSNQLNPPNPDDKIGDALLCAALAPWRLNKVIYQFDAELASALMDHADDIKIPIDALDSLPYPCVYIQLPEHPIIDGYFVHFEHDQVKGHLEFRALYLKKNGEVYPSNFHIIEGGLLSDGIRESAQLSLENLRNSGKPAIVSNSELEKEIATLTKMVSEWMQLVLYICSENADIRENAQQQKIYHPSPSVKDQFKEVHKYDVGEDVGIVIRNYKWKAKESTSETHNPTGSTNSVRPHIRHAHWHHYWTGSKSDDSRKLILKWIHPSFVNADGKNIDILPATVNKLK